MVSNRAAHVWKRLGSWYGARLAEDYGPTPPRDWCTVIDRADRGVLRDALVHIRQTCPIHPPTLPQLEAAIRAVSPPSEPPRDYREALTAEVLRRRLTPRQLISAWTWLPMDVPVGVGKTARVIGGVRVPADGASPEVTVTIRDLEGAGVAA